MGMVDCPGEAIGESGTSSVEEGLCDVDDYADWDLLRLSRTRNI